jgi:Tfp pilus assembly protein PilN
MLEQYYRINEAAGVDINIMPDGEIVVNICKIIIERNKLTFDKKVTDLQKPQDLTKHLAAKTPVALNISGKGVLEKQVEKIEELDESNFSKILPNANINDFYFQNCLSGEWSFISVIRKADANKWVELLKQLGLAPLLLCLGPFPVKNIMPQLNIYGDEIVFNGYNILRNEQMDWVSVHYNAINHSPFPLKIESEPVDEKLLMPYAAAFQLVLSDKIDPISTDALNEELGKLIEEKKMKTYGAITLLVFFVALLINFFLFSWFNSTNARLAEQLSTSAQNIDDIQEINKQIRQKEALLKTIGWEDNINKSALVDQIASLLPHELSWKEVEINPIDLTESRNQKVVVFQSKKIRIAGNSEKIIPVNEWVARIKSKPWVKNVQLDSYTFNNEINTGQFIISIDY